MMRAGMMQKGFSVSTVDTNQDSEFRYYVFFRNKRQKTAVFPSPSKKHNQKSRVDLQIMSWLRFAGHNSPGQWTDSNQRVPILGRLTLFVIPTMGVNGFSTFSNYVY